MADLILLLLLAKIHWSISVISIIASALVGAWLLRRQGNAVAVRLRSDLSGGQLPAEPILDGGMILLAAGLLLTPGFITDLFGITILIPACRRWYRARIGRWLQRKVQVKAEQIKSEFRYRQEIEGEFQYPENCDEQQSDSGPQVAEPRRLDT